MATLKSQLRGSLMSSHGSRKNTRNNLWLVYSHKLGLDLSLSSNRELIYWLSDLETVSSVTDFSFGHMARFKVDLGRPDFRAIEVIKVQLVDGTQEFHHLSGSVGKLERLNIPHYDEQGVEHISIYVRVSEEYLTTRALLASRLLNVTAFASQLRGKSWGHEVVEVGNIIKVLASGTVEAIINNCPRMDPMVALGICSQMVLAGKIKMDLHAQSFGRYSYWSLV